MSEIKPNSSKVEWERPKSIEIIRNRTQISELGRETGARNRMELPKSDEDVQEGAVIGTLYTLQSILTTQGTHTIWSPSSRSLFEGRSEVLLSKSEIFF